MMQKVKPKKSLGQHFLTDQSVARRIADTMNQYVGYPVIEVGPGMGVLTQYLLEQGHDLYVVEIDRESILYLEQNFPELRDRGRIIEADFLQLDLNELIPGDTPFCLIGNYPYNISSQIFFHALDYKDRLKYCSGMLQREVALRLAAPAGIKDRGILSVLLQAWYRVNYLFTVSEQVFNPPPKVKSGVVEMMRNQVTDLGCNPSLFKTVVKTTFGQRRKTIRNSLRGLLPSGVLFPESPLLAMRPEQLTVKQFIDLTNLTELARNEGR